jgi:hypothetical protein
LSAHHVILSRGVRKASKDYFAGLKSPLLDQLDGLRGSAEGSSNRGGDVSPPPRAPKEARKKAAQPLEKPEKEPMSEFNRGVMDTNGFHMCEILNEALSIASFDPQLHDHHKSLGLVIDDVVESVDRGVVRAYWSAPEIDAIIAFSRKEAQGGGSAKTAPSPPPTSSAAAATRPLTPADKLEKTLRRNLTELLQRAEPRFRAFLVKKMDFRRVPRVIFEPAKPRDEVEERISAAREFTTRLS